MKKLLIISLLCVFLFSCGKEKAVTTEEVTTTAPETTTEAVQKPVLVTTNDRVGDGSELVSMPRDDFETLFIYAVFPKVAGLYLVFGIVEDSPKELFVYSTYDNGATYTRVNCELPADIEFDRAIPVYAGDGGGSSEAQFVVMLQGGDTEPYIRYNNFTWTDFDNWHDFTCDGVLTAEKDEYIYNEVMNNPFVEVK